MTYSSSKLPSSSRRVFHGRGIDLKLAVVKKIKIIISNLFIADGRNQLLDLENFRSSFIKCRYFFNYSSPGEKLKRWCWPYADHIVA